MNLRDFFYENSKVALAFSGGVDSAFLLHQALACKANVRAYYVKSAFQPDFELLDAKRLAKELGADMKILELDILGEDNITQNPEDRCYYCKQRIFGAIEKSAREDGYNIIIDGTNASDSKEDRPGMKALEEMKVRSPLREAGLTKDMIRKLSKEAGLFTWDKPAYACLATRVALGENITAQKLKKIEQAEEYLASLGFRDFRVRMRCEQALVQVLAEDMARLLAQREQIVRKLKRDFDKVLLDLEGRDEQ